MKTRAPRQRSKWRLLTKPGPGEGRVIGQVRYSSDMQERRTITEQMENISRNAASEGWSVVGWCEEPATSAQYDELERRPEFLDLLTHQAGMTCNVVICDETSRWSRSDVGGQALRMLRDRNCLWQTADGVWDINKPLSDGGAILWAITQSQNEDFLRKLSYHVKKGMRAKARAGYSNGKPIFGYRVPPLNLPPEALANLGQIRRRRVVYEPHPDYFPSLQELGELLADEPPKSLPQIADEMNALGYRYWSEYYGDRPWSPMVIEGLLYRAYHREYANESGHGTIIMPTGDRVEGLHIPAWPYALCTTIDANRELLSKDHRARPRKGTIHVFSGLVYCAHCRSPLNVQSSTTRGNASYATDLRYTYPYYDCPTYEKTGVPCGAAVGERRHVAVRADLLELQFGVILRWLGEWPDEAIAYLHAALRAMDRGAVSPIEDVQHRRAELARRRENLSRQHEMGILTDGQLAERIAAIAKEEVRLPVPIAPRKGTAEELVGLIRGLGDQWIAANQPHQRGLRYQLVSALVRRVYVDMAAQRIVGLDVREDLALPVGRSLEARGWVRRDGDPDVLWNDDVPLPAHVVPSHGDLVLDALREGHQTSASIAAATGIRPYNNVNAILRRLVKQSMVRRERIQRQGKQYRYLLPPGR